MEAAFSVSENIRYSKKASIDILQEAIYKGLNGNSTFTYLDITSKKNAKNLVYMEVRLRNGSEYHVSNLSTSKIIFENLKITHYSDALNQQKVFIKNNKSNQPWLHVFLPINNEDNSRSGMALFVFDLTNAIKSGLEKSGKRGISLSFDVSDEEKHLFHAEPNKYLFEDGTKRYLRKFEVLEDNYLYIKDSTSLLHYFNYLSALNKITIYLVLFAISYFCIYLAVRHELILPAKKLKAMINKSTGNILEMSIEEVAYSMSIKSNSSDFLSDFFTKDSHRFISDIESEMEIYKNTELEFMFLSMQFESEKNRFLSDCIFNNIRKSILPSLSTYIKIYKKDETFIFYVLCNEGIGPDDLFKRVCNDVNKIEFGFSNNPYLKYISSKLTKINIRENFEVISECSKYVNIDISRTEPRHLHHIINMMGAARNEIIPTNVLATPYISANKKPVSFAMTINISNDYCYISPDLAIEIISKNKSEDYIFELFISYVSRMCEQINSPKRGVYFDFNISKIKSSDRKYKALYKSLIDKPTISNYINVVIDELDCNESILEEIKKIRSTGAKVYVQQNALDVFLKTKLIRSIDGVIIYCCKVDLSNKDNISDINSMVTYYNNYQMKLKFICASSVQFDLLRSNIQTSSFCIEGNGNSLNENQVLQLIDYKHLTVIKT